MKKRAIYITDFDLNRLKKLLAEKRAEEANNEYLNDLEEELDRAKIVESREVPPDVITMNSQVKLKDLETSEEMVLSLVFPAEADIDEGKISVLAPVGTGMIGYSKGDTIEWKVPAGMRKLKVMELLYQPEAAGDYDL